MRHKKAQRRKAALAEPQTLKLRPSTYQPKKAEMEERHRIAASPQEVAQAVLTPTKLVFEETDED